MKGEIPSVLVISVICNFIAERLSNSDDDFDKNFIFSITISHAGFTFYLHIV